FWCQVVIVLDLWRHRICLCCQLPSRANTKVVGHTKAAIGTGWLGPLQVVQGRLRECSTCSKRRGTSLLIIITPPGRLLVFWGLASRCCWMAGTTCFALQCS
ncbi:unnamed protein product, partial [Heterosigma akashiwo]